MIQDQASPLSPASPPVVLPQTLPQRSVNGRLDERGIIVITAVGHALCHIGELAFTGAMFAVMREFGLAPNQAIALALLGWVLMGAGGLPVGLWADAWGPTRVLMIYFVAMAVGGLAVALAPNTWLLFLALTTLGLATSIYHPTGLAMISLGVKDRGRAMGINGVAGSIGVATGPWLGIYAADLGAWRLAYVVIAVLAVLAAVLMVVARRRQARVTWRPQSDMPLCPPAAPAALMANATEDARPERLPRYLPLAFLFVAMMLGGFNYRCLVTALPRFLSGAQVESGQLPHGGHLVFLVLLVGSVGQYAGGWLADRFGSRRVYPLLIGMLVLSAFGLSFLEATPSAFGVACLVAIFLFAQQPVENSLLAEWTSRRRYGLSYGAKFALTFGVGALGAHVVGVIWTEYGSPAPAFAVLAGSAALMGVLVLSALRLFRTTRPGKLYPE